MIQGGPCFFYLLRNENIHIKIGYRYHKSEVNVRNGFVIFMQLGFHTFQPCRNKPSNVIFSFRFCFFYLFIRSYNIQEKKIFCREIQ